MSLYRAIHMIYQSLVHRSHISWSHNQMIHSPVVASKEIPDEPSIFKPVLKRSLLKVPCQCQT